MTDRHTSTFALAQTLYVGYFTIDRHMCPSKVTLPVGELDLRLIRCSCGNLGPPTRVCPLEPAHDRFIRCRIADPCVQHTAQSTLLRHLQQ